VIDETFNDFGLVNHVLENQDSGDQVIVFDKFLLLFRIISGNISLPKLNRVGHPLLASVFSEQNNPFRFALFRLERLI